MTSERVAREEKETENIEKLGVLHIEWGTHFANEIAFNNTIHKK